MRPLLRVRDLTVVFDTAEGQRKVVDGVSFAVGMGETLGILGESGSGKTISSSAVLGLIDDTPGVCGGEIVFTQGDHEISLLEGLDTCVTQRPDGLYVKDNRRWMQHVRRVMTPIWGCGMTAVFQNPRQCLDPLERIGAQVEESVGLAAPHLTAAERMQAALDWLQKVQMRDPLRVYRSYPHELSGGMCQRAMIAIALARHPALLIADEPTTGLDTTVRAEIVALFHSLIQESQASMIYISHDIREVLYLASRVIVMRSGRVLEEATSEDLLLGRGTRHPYTATLLHAADLPTGQVSETV